MSERSMGLIPSTPLKAGIGMRDFRGSDRARTRMSEQKFRETRAKCLVLGQISDITR